MSSNRRSKLIVDKRLQFQIAGLVISVGVVTCIISMLGLKLLSNKVIEILEMAEHNKELQLNVIEQFNHMSVQFILLTGVALAWAWIVTMYLSNRIVGPVYNMIKTLDKYIEGDKSARILLRTKDNFQPLAEKINKALDEKK